MASQLAALLADRERFRQATEKCFKEDDLDNSGSLEVNELHRVMSKVARAMGAVDPTPAEVRLTLQQTDVNQDGKVSFEEYQELARRLLTALHQRMVEQSSRGQHYQPTEDPGRHTPPPVAPRQPLETGPDKASDDQGRRTPPPVAPRQPKETKKDKVADDQVKPVDSAPIKSIPPPEVPLKPPMESHPVRPSPQTPVKYREEEVRTDTKPVSRSEALSRRMAEFEDYLKEWRLNDAMMQIFTEVEAKKLEPAQVYQYAATRLRQFGKDPQFLRH